MLSLTSTLIAAQQSASAAPALRVRLQDCDVGVHRLRWTRWYTGGEPDGPCGVAVPADGSLVRARIDPASGALSVQRVATPAATSTYSAWTALGTVVVAPRLGCHAAGTRVMIATLRTGGTQVELRESADSGVTFGASTLLVTAVATVTAVACAVRADGSAAVAWATNAGTVYSMRRTGLGAFGAPAAWTQSLASVNGLAMYDAADYALLVSGTTAAGVAGAWTTRLGSGITGPPGSWSPLVEVAGAASGTNVTYLASGAGHAVSSRLVFVETFAGIGAYARVQTTHAIATTTFDDHMWRSAQPLDIVTAYGLGFAGGGTHAYLAGPAGVWHASADAPLIDVSADVLEARLEESTSASATVARLRLRLRDDDGRYGPGLAPVALAPGADVSLDVGYETSAGIEYAEGRAYSITAVRRVRTAGAASVEIEARGAWGALEGWRAPGQVAWASGARSAFLVLSDIARRGGCYLTGGSPSAESDSLKPAYTVRAGERGDTAFARLLDRLPDVVRARDTTLTLTQPLTTDAVTYAYGVTHAIETLRVADAAPAAGWTRVFGAGHFAEAVDRGAVARGAPAAIVVDDNIDSTARALTRASAALRKAALEVDRGALTALPNAGQEVGDVIAVTDAALGLAAAPFRVTSLRLDYAATGARAPRFEMTLGLGEV